MESSNRFLTEEYLPGHNEKFAIKLIGDGSAFVPFAGDLANVLCVQEDRVVGKDNTVRYKNRCLQIPADCHRNHYVKARVRVHEYPNGQLATDNWRYSMGRENSPFTPLKERKSKTPKTWLRELLRPADVANHRQALAVTIKLVSCHVSALFLIFAASAIMSHLKRG